MQQYFSNKKETDVLYINEKDVHHIKNVMKIKPNEELIVTYDKISYLCTLNEDYKTAKIKEIYKSDTEKTYVLAYIPVLRDEKMSFIIEKGTEMGVSKFVPVNFSHSKFKIPKEKENKKIERWQKIAKEASEQSRRLIIPEVTNIINLTDIEPIDGVNILCSIDKQNVKSIKEVLNINTYYDKISLVFGPEGGISKSEEEYITKKNFTKTSLGKNVLRTETVIVCLCGIINYVNGW